MRTVVETLTLDGNGGNDTITLYGTGLADHVHGRTGCEPFAIGRRGAGRSALGFTTTTAYGSATGTATLYGSGSDDQFYGHEVYDQMFLGSGQTITLWNFATVGADVGVDDGTYGAVSGGNDTASVYDGLDTDTFTAGPTSGTLAYQAGNTRQRRRLRFAGRLRPLRHEHGDALRLRHATIRSPVMKTSAS